MPRNVLPKGDACNCRTCAGACTNLTQQKGWFQCAPCSLGNHQSAGGGPCGDFQSFPAYDDRITCRVCGYARDKDGSSSTRSGGPRRGGAPRGSPPWLRAGLDAVRNDVRAGLPVPSADGTVGLPGSVPQEGVDPCRHACTPTTATPTATRYDGRLRAGLWGALHRPSRREAAPGGAPVRQTDDVREIEEDRKSVV